MTGVLVVTILLGVGCISHFVNPVSAQDGCISHPLPPEVVDKIVDAANIAISQRKLDSAQTVDGHALATLALLQHSLSATKEEFSASKRDWENVSSTVTELTARTNDWDNAVASVSSLQSSLSSTQSELAASIRNCNNVSSTVTELTARTNDWDNAVTSVSSLQSSLSSTQSELAASIRNCNNVSSTVTELTAKTNDWDNAVTTVSSLQSSLSSTQSELAASIRNCNNGLTEIQSSLAVLRNELAELRTNYKSDISKLLKCRDGWLRFQDSCYFIGTEKVNWDSGRQKCLNMSSDYVKISTDEEFAFLSSQIVHDSWIGLNDIDAEGTFRWISDGTVHEINRAWWAEGQPNDHSKIQDCVDFGTYGGKKLFNDYDCGNSQFYICEMMSDLNTD